MTKIFQNFSTFHISILKVTIAKYLKFSAGKRYLMVFRDFLSRKNQKILKSSKKIFDKKIFFFEKFSKKMPKKKFFFDFFKFWSRKKFFHKTVSRSIIAYRDPYDSPETELTFFYNFFFYALLKNGHFWPFLAIFRNFGLLGVWTRGNWPEYDHMGLRIYFRV